LPKLPTWVLETGRIVKVLLYAAPFFVSLICLSNSITALAKSIWSDVGNNWAVVWLFATGFFSSTFSLFVFGTLGRGVKISDPSRTWILAALRCNDVGGRRAAGIRYALQNAARQEYTSRQV